MFVECHTLTQDARRKDCSLVRGFCFLLELVGNRLHFNWLSAAWLFVDGFRLPWFLLSAPDSFASKRFRDPFQTLHGF